MKPTTTVKPFAVITRDVDGSNTRRYTTLKAAAKRFEEMSGYSLQDGLENRYWMQVDAGLPLPTVEVMTSIRLVNAYGCVVTFVNDGGTV